MLDFDDEASRRVEEVYRTPDIAAQRRATVAMLALAPGERVLDIGSGPGFLACEIASAVGAAGAVHGVDPSDSMLAISARRERPEGAAPMTFGSASANALPFDDDSFDAVVSTQVYEYVPDMPGALAEARRVLRPGGRLLILDTDWESVIWHSRDPVRMRRVLAAWEEHLAHVDLPRRLTGLLRDAGFAVRDRSVLTLLNAGYEEGTYSSGILGVIAAFVPGRRGVGAEEAAEWERELRSLGDDYFFSICRYHFLASAERAGRS